MHPTQAVEVYYQCGIESTHCNMVLELLTQIIKQPCFDTLRTKEQLGKASRNCLKAHICRVFKVIHGFCQSDQLLSCLVA